MLIAENLHTGHGHLHVLKGIDLEVRRGEILAVVGSNGAGKSTLLGALAGVYPIWKGRILYENRDITSFSVEQVIPLGISLVPERRQIFASLSVLDNLLLGAYHRYRKEKKRVMEDVEQVLELFPRLRSMLDRPGGLLSGGEQQMLAIGRALMAQPRLILMDEPSLGLAPLMVKNIMHVLKRMRDELETTVVLVEQNVKAALKIADRACVLERGEIVARGDAREMMNDPMIQASYLGKRKEAL